MPTLATEPFRMSTQGDEDPGGVLNSQGHSSAQVGLFQVLQQQYLWLTQNPLAVDDDSKKVDVRLASSSPMCGLERKKRWHIIIKATAGPAAGYDSKVPSSSALGSCMPGAADGHHLWRLLFLLARDQSRARKLQPPFARSARALRATSRTSPSRIWPVKMRPLPNCARSPSSSPIQALPHLGAIFRAVCFSLALPAPARLFWLHPVAASWAFPSTQFRVGVRGDVRRCGCFSRAWLSTKPKQHATPSSSLTN